MRGCAITIFRAGGYCARRPWCSRWPGTACAIYWA